MTVQDAEHIVMLISIVGGLFCARVWSVAAVAVIAGLLFPTLLTLFVSPEWKRLGFERYFEMKAGNARYLFLGRTSSGALLGASSDWSGAALLTKEKIQNESDEGVHGPIKPFCSR